MSSTTHAFAPEPVQPGIWRLPIPLHARAEPVNSWLLVDPDDGSVVIFDTGVAPDAHERFSAALDDIGAAPSDVRSIVVSHQHPDHVGGTRALHELTGAPLVASASTIDHTHDVWGYDGRLERYMGEIRLHLLRHGLAPEISDRLVDDHVWARVAIELAPQAAWTPVADGDLLRAGGRDWRVVFVPGHADGQLVLHDAQGGLLLSADHLLERISPAIGKFPEHEPDPLGRYLESLDRVASLDHVELVLPGHGTPFRGAAQRAHDLVAHHVDRIDACVAALSAPGGQPMTAFDVARIAFPRVFIEDPVDAPSARFATTEALAHLEHARVLGRVATVLEDDDVVTWIRLDA